MAIKVNSAKSGLLRIECTPADIKASSGWGAGVELAASIGMKAWQLSEPNQAFTDIFNKYEGALAFAGGCYYKVVSNKKRYQNFTMVSTPNTAWSRDFNQVTFISKAVSTAGNNLQNADGIIMYFWILNT